MSRATKRITLNRENVELAQTVGRFRTTLNGQKQETSDLLDEIFARGVKSLIDDLGVKENFENIIRLNEFILPIA